MLHPPSNEKAIRGMVVAMALFSLNDLLVKLTSAEWPVAQILFIRGAMASLVIGGAALAIDRRGALRAFSCPFVLLRAAIESAVALTYITALQVLPLADVTAILLSAPLMITGLSALFLGEAVGWRRWLAAFVGFFGILLIVKPSASPDPMMGLALLSTALVALRDLLTRRLPAEVSSLGVALVTTFGAFLTGAVLSGAEVAVPLGGPPLAMMALAALTLVAGNLFMVIAARQGELSVIAPFRYSVMLFALGFGFAFFGTLPDRAAFAGIILIIAAGLYTLGRERRRRAAHVRGQTLA